MFAPPPHTKNTHKYGIILVLKLGNCVCVSISFSNFLAYHATAIFASLNPTKAQFPPPFLLSPLLFSFPSFLPLPVSLPPLFSPFLLPFFSFPPLLFLCASFIPLFLSSSTLPLCLLSSSFPSFHLLFLLLLALCLVAVLPCYKTFCHPKAH